MPLKHISIGQCKKDVTPLLTHWSYVFLALTHRFIHVTDKIEIQVPTFSVLGPGPFNRKNMVFLIWKTTMLWNKKQDHSWFSVNGWARPQPMREDVTYVTSSLTGCDLAQPLIEYRPTMTADDLVLHGTMLSEYKNTPPPPPPPPPPPNSYNNVLLSLFQWPSYQISQPGNHRKCLGHGCGLWGRSGCQPTHQLDTQLVDNILLCVDRDCNKQWKSSSLYLLYVSLSLKQLGDFFKKYFFSSCCSQ